MRDTSTENWRQLSQKYKEDVYGRYCLIRGWIIDGTRTPPYQADLCIQDGKIVAISPSVGG